MVNGVLAGIVSKFLGELNLALGYQEQVGLNPSKGRIGIHHVIDGREISHRGGVARSRLDLLTIGKGLTDTVIDKVIPKRS